MQQYDYWDVATWLTQRPNIDKGSRSGGVKTRRDMHPGGYNQVSTELGRGEVVNAAGFDPAIRRFESYRPSHFFSR